MDDSGVEKFGILGGEHFSLWQAGMPGMRYRLDLVFEKWLAEVSAVKKCVESFVGDTPNSGHSVEQ